MDTRSCNLQLENQLCFPLYACSREVTKRYRPCLEELDLTYTQYVAMMVIWAEGTVSVRDMGRKLYLDSGTLTPVLKNLEAKGMIHRRRSTQDERVLLVSATDAGLALKEKAAAISTFEMESSGLTADEAATLRTLLYKLLAGSQEG